MNEWTFPVRRMPVVIPFCLFNVYRESVFILDVFYVNEPFPLLLAL